MFDVLFTLPGAKYPFPHEMRLSWSDASFEFQLLRTGLLVTADRCFEPNAGAVLDAFLDQLVVTADGTVR